MAPTNSVDNVVLIEIELNRIGYHLFVLIHNYYPQFSAIDLNSYGN